MKKYYIFYYKDFGNTYSLFWADSPEMEAELPEGAERITRNQAEAKCREERRLRKFDPAFGGYGDAEIFPADYDREFYDIRNNPNFFLDGFIWEKKCR